MSLQDRYLRSKLFQMASFAEVASDHVIAELCITVVVSITMKNSNFEIILIIDIS